MDKREATGRDSQGRFVVKHQKGEILWSIVLGGLAAALIVVILS